jgi:hypothetical protein
VLLIPSLLGLQCEPVCDSSISEESEDLDTFINKAIHDLNPSDLPGSLPRESDQSLYAEVIRVQVQALEAVNEVSSLTTPSCEPLHTPSTPESPYESASESIHKSTYSYSLTIVASRFPDFKMCGTFDSESNAARWHDFERRAIRHLLHICTCGPLTCFSRARPQYGLTLIHEFVP